MPKVHISSGPPPEKRAWSQRQRSNEDFAGMLFRSICLLKIALSFNCCENHVPVLFIQCKSTASFHGPLNVNCTELVLAIHFIIVNIEKNVSLFGTWCK